jgi:hypothetical protein
MWRSWSLRMDIAGPMRRCWQVRPSRVSPRCWRWLTGGYGPPWQQEEGP